MLKPSLWSIALLVIGAAATRLAPHWWNLTAVGAVCLFGGAYFQKKWLAFVVPLAALAVSDVFLQIFVYPQFGPNYFKYVCFAMTVPLGFLLRGRMRLQPVGAEAKSAFFQLMHIVLQKLLPAGATAVIATVLFFLLSNFEVWVSGHGNRYPLTPTGLLACYVAAIPFSLNMLKGNLLYSGLLFGGMEFWKAYRPLALPSRNPVTVRAS